MEPLQLGARELLTFGTVLVGLASGWAMIRGQLANHVIQIKKAFSRLHELEHRLDSVESAKARSESQLSTITQHILSPAILKKQSERDGAVEQRLLTLERETAGIRRMHNDSHPPQKS